MKLVFRPLFHIARTYVTRFLTLSSATRTTNIYNKLLTEANKEIIRNHQYFELPQRKTDRFKVARYSFSGSIPLKCEHKLRCQKQSFGKIATTVVLENDENLLWSVLQRHRSCHSNKTTLLPILLAAVYLGTGNCSSKIIHGSFFLQ